MITTTTDTVENRPIRHYLGLVVGRELVPYQYSLSFKDMMKSGKDSGAWKWTELLEQAHEEAMKRLEENARALGANAVVGISVDYEHIESGNIIFAVATGTAVKLD